MTNECGTCAKVNGESDGQSYGSRRIRSSSSDAATVRLNAAEADLGLADDASTQIRRISDPACHAASASAESTTNILGGHVTHEGPGSPGATPHPRQHISNQRRRLATAEVKQRTRPVSATRQRHDLRIVLKTVVNFLIITR